MTERMGVKPNQTFGEPKALHLRACAHPGQRWREAGVRGVEGVGDCVHNYTS